MSKVTVRIDTLRCGFFLSRGYTYDELPIFNDNTDVMVLSFGKNFDIVETLKYEVVDPRASFFF